MQAQVDMLANGYVIDPSKPLLAQVGQLGSSYDAWAHQAVPGRPRLFGPDWMEVLTLTPWYMVPVIWVPASIICMVVSSLRFGHGAVGILRRSLFGLFLWYCTEYFLHRFLFHYVPKSRWGHTIHFLFHGIHHKYPNDPYRLVFPPVPCAGIVAVLVSIFRLFQPWSETLPVLSGFLVGYVMYDCTHYFVHHMDTKNNAWLDALRASHMDHHYRDHHHGYGITSSFFDRVCGTSNRWQLWSEPARRTD